MTMGMHGAYHFWGMHLFWWIVWVGLLIWIFATPYEIPGARRGRDGAMDILKKRFAKGEIDEAEFTAKKKLLQGE